MKPLWAVNFSIKFPSSKFFEFGMGLGAPDSAEAEESEPAPAEAAPERTPAGFSPNPQLEEESAELTR